MSFGSLIIHENDFFFFFTLVGLLLSVQGLQCMWDQQDGLISCDQLIHEYNTETKSSYICTHFSMNRLHLSKLYTYLRPINVFSLELHVQMLHFR